MTKRIAPFIRKNFSKYDAVIVSDYGKGIVQPSLVVELTALAKERKGPGCCGIRRWNILNFMATLPLLLQSQGSGGPLSGVLSRIRARLLVIAKTRLDTIDAVKESGTGLFALFGNRFSFDHAW